MAGLRFIVLLFKATLRLFVSCVIMEQMLRHVLIMEWRPLHLAAMNGHISVVKELIEERNAEVNARDDDGMTALTWASNNPIIAAYLISRGGGGIE
jgi:hypothetical protein